MSLFRGRGGPPSSFLISVLVLALLLFLIFQHSSSSYNDDFYSFSSSHHNNDKSPSQKGASKVDSGRAYFPSIGSFIPSNRSFFNPFPPAEGDDSSSSNRQKAVEHGSLEKKPPTPSKPKGVELPGFCEVCGEEDMWCRRYGPQNLARSHAYTGSAHRFRQLVLAVLRGEKTKIKLGVLGGSVTDGHGVRDGNKWPELYGEYLEAKFREISGRNDIVVEVTNGAVPATETNYYQTCWKEHLDEDMDLVVIEMAINDRRFEILAESYEYLLRALLEMPSKPAVLNLHIIALSFERITTGGDLHLAVSNYYDSPVISVRNMLLPHILANPSISPEPLPPNPRDKTDEHYFTLKNLDEYWFSTHMTNNDLRHMNTNGHALMSDLLSAWSERAVCAGLKQFREMKDGVWKGAWKAGDNTIPGEEALDYIPRLRMFDRYDRTTVRAPIKSTCMTVTSKKHPLKAYKQNGWEIWAPPQRPDKVYWRATKPGSLITFEIESGGGLGEVTVTYLRSKTFGMGSAWVWISTPGETKGNGELQTEENMKPWGIRLDGWWDVEGINSAGGQVVARDLKPGKHLLHVELITETKDPGGGHDFRITAVDAS